MIFYCSICGKQLPRGACVPNTTRKNKVGRIAWGRDCVCAECREELAQALDEAVEKLKSRHVKAHDRGAALRLFAEAMEVKGVENANLSCKGK